jgi:hypothetical protein
LIVGGVLLYVWDKRFCRNSNWVSILRLDRRIGANGLRIEDFRRTTFADDVGNRGDFFTKILLK